MELTLIKKTALFVGLLFGSTAFAAGEKKPILGAMTDSHPMPFEKLMYAETDRGERSIVSLNGRYVILGDFKIVDMWRSKEVKGVEDVKAMHLTPTEKIKAALDGSSWFRFGKGKEEAYIFTDFSSHYNGELFPKFTPALTDKYTFYVIYSPLTNSSLAVPINKAIHCSVSPEDAYKAVFDYSSTPKRLFKVLNQIGVKPDCTSKKMVNSATLANILSIQRVPTVVNPNGVRLVSPKNLEGFLNEK